MTDFFLRAKHWQIFMLGLGIPLLMIVVIMLLLYVSTLNGGYPSQNLAFACLGLYLLSTIVSMFAQFGWLWSIVTGLNKLLPEELRPSLTRFKIAFWLPIIYILLFLLTLLFAAVFVSLSTVFVSPTILIFIAPLHFMAMGCIFYCLFVAAKTIKTVDVQREVGLSDFIGEFVLLWVYPAGIWIIQPIINDMHSGSHNVE